MVVIPGFLEPIDHLRNFRRRETPARERVERALPADEAGKARAPFPDPLQRAVERGFFRLGLPLREGALHRLAREAAGAKLAFEPPRAVAVSPDPHRGPGGAEIVQQPLGLEPDESARDRFLLETALRQRPRKLLAAARPDREETKRALARALGGVGAGRVLSDRVRPSYRAGGT
jgi:hypothetical protein